MRCPKCHYISYDASDRCRNCGYEFSFSVDVKALDLPIQTGDEPEGPLSDFALTDLDEPAPEQPPAPPAPPVAVPAAPTTGFDLPLFKDRAADDDRPLVTPPAVPRPPLAVRKGAPIVSRGAPRARVEEPELDLGSPELPAAVRHTALAPAEPVAIGEAAIAPLGRRAGAAIVDLVILAAIDLAILYFTLRLCGLQLVDLRLIPAIPFVAFLVMQNGGYLAAFVAAGGQTIGKMLFDIRVVPAVEGEMWSDRVGFGRATLRAVAWLLSVLPAGLGVVPAFFSQERRALHDRLAGTRVVRA
jgi:uncharacterized RDD family membrane protein YckC